MTIEQALNVVNKSLDKWTHGETVAWEKLNDIQIDDDAVHEATIDPQTFDLEAYANALISGISDGDRDYLTKRYIGEQESLDVREA